MLTTTEGTFAEFIRVTLTDKKYSVKPMMRLQLSSKPPTPLQKLALEIMAFTFPLLSVEISPAQLESVNPRNRYRKAKIDAYIQAVHHAWANNLAVPPPPAVDDRPPAAAANRQIIVRVGVDAFLLVLRASMVYWFLKPFTRTLTGVAYVGWILYELYQLWARPQPNAQQGAGAGAGGQRPAAGAVAGGGAAPAPVAPGGGGGGGGAGAAQNNQPNGGAGAGAVVAVPGANGAVGGNRVDNNVAPAAGGDRGNLRNLLHRCARVGLEAEAKASIGAEQPGGGRTHERLGWRHRVMMFFVMLVLTVHPQYWTERQQLLRERERELRVLYGTLREDGEEPETQQANGNAPANGTAQEANGDSQKTEKAAPAPKPPLPEGFVGQYVHRARRGVL